jgi:CheY-like chemotaxis protein
LGWRVLYVDDEDDLREVAQMSLELDPEIGVRCSASGAEALDELGNWQPDLILMDVMMPEMDGPVTLARIRARGESPPVVFITARAGANDTARLMALGALGVIPKPFDPMSLAATVRHYL